MTNVQPTISIDSRAHWNDTGIDVVEGVGYDVSVSGRWRDASHACGPEGWPGTPFVNLFTVLRRARSLPWFALVGSVDRKRPYVHLLPNRPFVASSSGRLHCFANDAYGFYGNNDGALVLSVVASAPVPS